jgi:hypothetical protein
MRAIKAFSTVALTLIALLAPAFLTQSVKADVGTAKVYILMLPDIGGSWVDSCEQVKDGAIQACMLGGNCCQSNVPRVHPKPEDINYPPYYSATPSVVTSWITYKDIILNYAGVIIVNTHGEILPIPNGYTEEEWVDKISEAMLMRRVTWVHVAGYPFYYVKYESGVSETWGENGFKHFMNNINKGDVSCWPPMDWLTLVEQTNVTDSDESLGNFAWSFDGVNYHDIKDFASANLGRPLKYSDFKDYLINALIRIQ